MGAAFWFAVFSNAILLALVLQGVQGIPIQKRSSSTAAVVQFLQTILQEYHSNQHDEIDNEDAIVMDDTYNGLVENDQTALSIQSDECDCCHSLGGCKVCKLPPKNKACKCSYNGFWTCSGEVVDCKDQNNPHCKNPNKSRRSCLQGGGDCGGYRGNDCNCDYSSNGGCRISTPPPKGKACYCDYIGFLTCVGSTTRCKDPNSPYCKNPDHSIFTCLQGGGDCDGYEELSCDCSYDSTGGCKITTPAPKNYACKCHFDDLLTKCDGSIRICADPNSLFCENPDTSAASCVQGGGDCDGYPGCNCHNARTRGCRLMVDPAPKHTACRCKKKFIGITEYIARATL